jgi:hypothetical protein
MKCATLSTRNLDSLTILGSRIFLYSRKSKSSTIIMKPFKTLPAAEDGPWSQLLDISLEESPTECKGSPGAIPGRVSISEPSPGAWDESSYLSRSYSGYFDANQETTTSVLAAYGVFVLISSSHFSIQLQEI